RMQRGTRSVHALALILPLALASFAVGVAPSASAADASAAPATGKERVLFDGKTLQGLTVTDFAGHGEVYVDKGLLVLNQGYMTGVHWTNNPPKTNYEISLEARRVSGNDFFCGLTFPIAGTNASLIVGGWGGSVVGISSIDGNDASSNDTTKFMTFEKDRWYAIRVRVTPKKLEAWIDKEKVVDTETEGKNFGLRSGPIEESAPLGIATYETQAHLRNIKLIELPAP
ncbi:MAG: family 16 glycoside hydrolase, partial [Limisphaerales bacterium]